MRLIDALPVTAATRVAFVGAGGKSTSMFRLARQALADGAPTGDRYCQYTFGGQPDRFGPIIILSLRMKSNWTG